MNRGFSLWLDLLRVIATVVVVISHWAYPRFTNGDFIFIRDWNLGSDAVIFFFVISGLVIAYAAERDADGATFVFNRLTRLWSVLIPALVLTFIFDRVGFGISEAAYPGNYYHVHDLGTFMLRGITFSNEFRLFDRMRLGTNGPLWSLSYEAAYYALFAAVTFLGGLNRIIVVAALIALVGVPILLLMPAWLMGVFVWRSIRDGRFIPQTVGLAMVLAVGAPVLYALCIAFHVPDILVMMFDQALNIPFAHRALGFSDEFIWNAIIGMLAVLHLFGIARLWQARVDNIAWIRWCAGASFSVYVTHYPALHLLDAIMPEPMFGRYPLLLVGSIAVGLVFASIFERNLKTVRHVLFRFKPTRA